MSNGKGSTSRPRAVSRAEFDRRWDETFGTRRAEDLRVHDCPEDTWWREYDVWGIYLCRVCPVCREAKLSLYRPEILSGYSQADVDEPIEGDE